MIGSRRNGLVLQARKLAQRKHRQREGLCLLEGRALVQDAIRARVGLEHVFVREGETFEAEGTVHVTAEHVFQSLTNTVTPQGVVAVARIPQPSLPHTLLRVVVLDRVSDSGNVGTIIRTCAACGIDAVLLTPSSADPWSPKTLRAGMGSQFRIPVLEVTHETIQLLLQKHKAKLLLSSCHNGCSMHALDWTPPWFLVLGSEAHGIHTKLQQTSALSVHIPMQNEVESLNVGVAAGILLYHTTHG